MNGEKDLMFSPRLIIGVAIVLIGGLSLLANLGFRVDIDLWDYWPVILILVGLSMLIKKTGISKQPGRIRIIDFGNSLPA